MLITPINNPYKFLFSGIVENIKNNSINYDSFAKLCRDYKFSLQKVKTLHPAYSHNILRMFYLNRKLDLVIKISNRHDRVPNFKYVIPTYSFQFNNKTVTIQPFGDIATRDVREKLARSFRDELVGFDCVPDNFVVFRGLPALIDW